MAFERDRIDGTSAIPQLLLEKVTVRGEEATVELLLSATHEIELYFPAPGGAVEAKWLELAADVLVQLTAIDNEVQRVSAEHSVGSQYPASYYEGELAYITLIDPDAAVLGYFVSGCNSEWDERLLRTGGGWVRVTDAEPPDATSDSRKT